jgi:hypothetical protein
VVFEAATAGLDAAGMERVSAYLSLGNDAEAGGEAKAS